MTRAIIYAALVALIFGSGFYVAHLQGERNLSQATSAWDKSRADLESKRAEAEAAQRRAEHNQAEALSKAADSYQKGKDDAKHSADQAVADLAAGNRRLRDQWATCQATTAAVSSAASGQRPDGEDRLREASVGRILRAVGQCQAQRDALQQALMGEREGQ